jgi:gamma-butyrobetaine dioxygenase
MMAISTTSRGLGRAAVSLAGGIVHSPSCKSTLLCPTLAGRCRSQFGGSPQRKFSKSTPNCNKESHPALVAPAKGKKRLNLELDGSFITFDYLFLRDACSCPQCVHPSTRQKLFQTTDIPYDVHPAVIETLGDGTLRIQWADDIQTASDATHESYYSPDFLRRYSTLRNRVRSRFNDQRQILWAGKQMERHVLWVDYSDYMCNDNTLFRAMKQLSSYGLMFIRGIPEAQKDAIEGVAERIGNLKTTFYGKTWDVKSAKDSKNIA